MQLKTTLYGIGVITLLISSCSQQNDIAKTISLENERDSLSYSFGVNIGSKLISDGYDSINIDVFAKAFGDVFGAAGLALTTDQCQEIITEYFESKQTRNVDNQNTQNDPTATGDNLAAGLAFLEANKNKEGLVVLESGVQYKILKEGSGAKPTLNDRVTTHYHGMLIDGTVFDSSVDRGTPATFPLNGVIQGWQIAIQLMEVGSKWILYIPPHLAYGDRGTGPILPNSTLIFEVELLGINIE